MKNTDSKIKVRLVRNKLKSAEKSPYLLKPVYNGVCRTDELLAEVAKNLGITEAQSRLCYDAMVQVIGESVAKGYRVETPLGTFEPAISGSSPCEDSPFDPKRNKLYVKVTPPASLQREFAKLVPTIVDRPESALMIGEIITASLGAKGYNTVSNGEPFLITGDGFTEDGELSVTLTDAKGVKHEVAVDVRKKTSLVCSLAGSAAKGRAELEIVLENSEPDIVRFTASRKVMVK